MLAFMNPLFATDAYKLSHKGFMVPGTTEIYSNGTPRNAKYLPVNKEDHDGKILWFGLQGTMQELVDSFDDNFFTRDKPRAIAELKFVFDCFLGPNAVDTKHFEQLHDLGYLPIRVKRIREGKRVPMKVPVFTIRNTHKDFAWLTNFLETVLSAETWKATTVATIIAEYRKLINRFAMETVGHTMGTEFQVHDFSYRGMGNTHDAAKCGTGFLLSSRGTDTVPALIYASRVYDANLEKDFVGTSVPASEHSLASAGIAVEGELETIRRWVTKDYPTGIVSVISDTLDFFKVVTEYATALREDILNRQPNALGLAKVVFRPDSGKPEHIIAGYRIDPRNFANEQQVYSAYDYTSLYCEVVNVQYEVVNIQGRYFKLSQGVDGRVGCAEEISRAEAIGAVECLAEVFGTTLTAKGYKQLHERVGLIYGDSITLAIAKDTLQRLKEKGYASTNVVFGVGSYTCQYLTRDSMGFAVKATSTVVNGERFALSKDPVTDDGTKKSAKGLLRVDLVDGEYVLTDNCTEEQEAGGELEVLFEDGQFFNTQEFAEIRADAETYFNS